VAEIDARLESEMTPDRKLKPDDTADFDRLAQLEAEALALPAMTAAFSPRMRRATR
jgi:hypothetical protein